MTATDQRIARGVADLREQLDHFGQANPGDVREFLDLVESTLARTTEFAIAPVVPLRRRSPDSGSAS